METILAAVDGSPYSEVVARYAAELARIAGAQVLAAYVVDVRLVAGPLAGLLAEYLGAGNHQEFSARLAEALQHHARASLAVAERACADRGVQVRTTVEQGRPAEVLAAMAPLYDLAVVGSLGWNAHFGTGLIGTTTSELLRMAPRPVMLVREEYRPVHRVLVGYDGSPEARRGLAWAAKLAGLAGWELTTATVGMRKSRAEHLRSQVENLAAVGEVPCEIAFLRGTPDQALIALAMELSVDLIVVGSRGASKHGRKAFGGTADTLCRQARVPVLVYR
ncbi:MAG: universal stress protein [Armatimonadetes bacterium]|nr:universal stress protein [Armatimonadota bacterium]